MRVNPSDEGAAGARCCACGREAVETVLDLGPQPPSNLFLTDPAQACPRHPLRFGVCHACGLAQLVDPMPESMARCTHDWLRYDEPEQHLDAFAALLHSRLPGKKARVCGVSYKDTTLLERLGRMGWDVVPKPEDGPGADVVIARHILEHAREPRRFVEECARLLSPDGMLVFEVPGCDVMLRRHLHCFLWEEHTVYFTGDALRRFLESCGLEVLELIEYPMPLENSVAALARPARESGGARRSAEGLEAFLTLLREFGASFPRRRQEMRDAVGRLADAGHAVNLLGAGHLGMKFINFYGIGPLLGHVLDDHPHKQGTYLPGSLLQVAPSRLLEQEGGVCLLAVNPEKYEAIRRRYTGFAARGGRWLSIFADPEEFLA